MDNFALILNETCDASMSEENNEYKLDLRHQMRAHVLVFSTVLCLILGLIILLIWKQSSTEGKKDSLLIIGSSDSGKTALFLKLTGQDVQRTLPSICQNARKAKVGVNSDISMIIRDIPGTSYFSHHHKIHVDRAVIVVLVVDAVDCLLHIRDTAKKLLQVLDDSAFKKQPVPIFIAVNKADLRQMCHTEKNVRGFLQTEIDLLRKQYSHSIREASAFTFDQLKSEVAIAKISVMRNELNPLHEFISKHAK